MSVSQSLLSAGANMAVPVVNVIFNNLEMILPNMYSNGRYMQDTVQPVRYCCFPRTFQCLYEHMYTAADTQFI